MSLYEKKNLPDRFPTDGERSLSHCALHLQGASDSRSMDDGARLALGSIADLRGGFVVTVDSMNMMRLVFELR